MNGLRVLIVRLSAMGDVIHALPLAANLRRAGHRVGWVVEAPFADLLSGNPHLEAIFVADTKKWRRRPFSGDTRRAFFRLRRDLARFRPEVVLDVQANEKSWWISRLCGGARIVLDDRSVRGDWTRRLSTIRVSPPEAVSHVSDRCLALLGPLRVPVRQRAPEALYLLEASGPAAQEFLSGLPRPFALYHPGAGWANKSWGEERFARLAARLREDRGIFPVVSWGPGDERRAEIVSRLLSAPRIPRTGFADFARIISEASFFAAGDTGPLHLADALHVPTVSFFGPTNPARNGPRRGASGLVFWAGLDCAPCLKRYGMTKACLTSLAPDAAATAVTRWLPVP